MKGYHHHSLFLRSRRMRVHENEARIMLLMQEFIILSLSTLLTKCSCSAALFLPISSTEIRNTELCPNPLDWREPFPFPYRYYPDSVLVMDLMMGNQTNNRSSTVEIPTCKFGLGRPGTLERTGKIDSGKIEFLSLQQLEKPIGFSQKCSRILGFPGFWEDQEITQGTRCATRAPNKSVLLDPSLIRTVGSLRWNKDRDKDGDAQTVMSFELPENNANYQYLVAVFKITSNSVNKMMKIRKSKCEIQIQQYYRSNDSSYGTCMREMKHRLLHNICGTLPCTKESDVLLEKLRKGKLPHGSNMMSFSQKPNPLYDLTNEDFVILLEDGTEFFPHGARIKSVGYFLKGMILPLCISVSAVVAYTVWRRRMKALARHIAELQQNGDGDVESDDENFRMTGLDEEGALIHFEDVNVGETREKPPAYDSLLSPPTYEQATTTSAISMVDLLYEMSEEELRAFLNETRKHRRSITGQEVKNVEESRTHHHPVEVEVEERHDDSPSCSSSSSPPPPYQHKEEGGEG